jgi:NAD(P)H dehydrogenase (quinone)
MKGKIDVSLFRLLWKITPIPFRPQNAGAYDIPELMLRPDVAPDRSGFAAHTV